MYKKLILILIRRRLGVRPLEAFRFANQKTDDVYWFDQRFGQLLKQDGCHIKTSGVSLNWLLNDECKIKKIEEII